VYAFGLAWRTLVHNRLRTLIAAIGVGFAVLLLFLQLGFYGAVGRTATMLFDHLRCDLVIVSSEHQDLTRVRDFPRGRLAQAREVPGVAAVTPLSIARGQWRNPNVHTHWWSRKTVEPGTVSLMFMVGVPPDQVGRAFRTGPEHGTFPTPEDAETAGRKLTRLDTVLLDARARPEFGDYELFSTQPASEMAPELNQRRVEVVGACSIGTSFSWNGMLITSEETLSKVAYRSTEKVTFGLVELAPGADPVATKAALQTVLPPDVRVLTPEEAKDIETAYWVDGNNIGKVLWATVLLAVVVGVIFLYQMMASDVRNRLIEFATAKALGYRSADLSATVLWQAVLLALIGFVPGLAVSAVLYEVFGERAGLPMQIDPVHVVLVLVLTVGMCVGSGLVAVRKATVADPANLF
jgi:putative ABC transport system permease protein